MPAGARDFRKRRSKWISEGGAAGRQSHSNLGGGTNKVLGVPLLTSGNIYCTFLAGHAAALQILIFWIHSQCNILMLYSATNSRIFSLSRISKVWLVNKGRPAKSCKDGNDTHTYVYTYTYYVYMCILDQRHWQWWLWGWSDDTHIWFALVWSWLQAMDHLC